MADPIYEVSIEFATGSFTNVTSDVLRMSINRDGADMFRGMKSNQGSLIFANYDQKYSPANLSSPLSPHLLPNKAIRIRATHASILYDVFTGFTDRYQINPSPKIQTVTMGISDRVKQLQLQELTLPLETNINVGSLFTNILSGSNIAAIDRVVDTFQDVIPFAWYNSERPDNSIQNLMKFGQYRAFTGSDGKINIKSRFWGIDGVVVNSYTSGFASFGYSLDEKGILNNVNITGTPRKKSTTINTIAWLETIPIIASGGVLGFWLDYVDPDNINDKSPADTVLIPVSSSDYTTNTQADGLGTDRTSLTTITAQIFGSSIVCSLSSSAPESVFLTKFQVRGNSIQKQPEFIFKTSNSSSQTVYGKREFTFSSSFIDDLEYATDYGSFLITERKDPAGNISFGLKNQFPDVLKNDLGDIVHLVEPNTSINSLWIIRALSHNINLQRGLEHTTKYTVEYWRDRFYFILDKSPEGQLDQGRKLAF